MITGNALSLGVMIGLLMLMGIVAKNAILLVDFAIEEMRAGKDRLTAIVEADPQARAPHRHDDRGDGRRHAAGGLGMGGDDRSASRWRSR